MELSTYLVIFSILAFASLFIIKNLSESLFLAEGRLNKCSRLLWWVKLIILILLVVFLVAGWGFFMNTKFTG